MSQKSTHRCNLISPARRKAGRNYLSPDLNPNEIALSKLNAHRRTFDTLFTALGSICDLFTPWECGNHFKAAGYASNQPSAALTPDLFELGVACQQV